MQNVRRLYFYLVALISLEVVVWGVIYLARTLFKLSGTTGVSNLLATGLSLVLVGLPIFLLHWLIAQRHALRDTDERSTLIRAVFLYAVQLAVLVPVVQSLLAILIRWSMDLFQLSGRMSLIGGGQTFVDNLVAIAVNLVAWVYFSRVLRADWQSGIHLENLVEVRRLYRYIWMLYGLVFAVLGVQSLLRYLLGKLASTGGLINNFLANGIPLTLVGALIWSVSWQVIQRRRDDPHERTSTLRLVVLHLITLASALIVFFTGIWSLTELLRWLLGSTSAGEFIRQAGGQLALLAPMAVLWAYYEQQRRDHLRANIEPVRQPGVERFYRYALSFLGLAGSVAGALMLVEALVQILFGARSSLILNDILAPGLAGLAAGLPLWLINWLPLQRATLDASNAGEQARRSLIRKIYLYIILFLSIIGVMVVGGRLFFLALSQLLGDTTPDFGLNITRRLAALLVVAVVLAYHLAALRRDGAQTQRTLTDRHVRFPVLILQRGEDGFAQMVADALERLAPQMPVAVHYIESAPLGEDLVSAKAVVVPSTLAIHSPEALRVWLAEYHGTQLFVPLPANGWSYLGSAPRTPEQLAQDTAFTLRELAEGQDARRPARLSPWTIAAIVVAGILIVPPLLLMILGLAFSGFD